MAEPRIVVLADAEALASHVAQWIADEIKASSGRFAIALSGGSTPKRLYELLDEEPHRSGIDWSRVHLFLGDERFVPYDNEDSNYGMARRALIEHVAIPPQNLHPMPTDGTPADAARRYELELRNYYGADVPRPDRPLFDVNLLGLGENGHTASLFPDTPALDEMRALVTAVEVNVPQPRLTLTYPAIASSRHVVFLAAGHAKRDVIRRVLAGDRSQPAARVTSVGGITWFVDEAAKP